MSGLGKKQQLLRLGLLICLLWPVLTLAERGLLFEIQKPGEEPSYLLGTIHSEDPRVLKLPEVITRALQQSQDLVLEIPLDLGEVLQVQLMMLLPPEQSLSELLRPELYRRLLPVAASIGLNEQMLQRYQPWALAMLLSMPPPRTGQFLDLVLYQAAVEMGKPVGSLERAEEQLQLFSGLASSQQERLLEEALNNYPELPLQTEELTEAWLSRDLERLQDLSRESLGDPELDRWFRLQVVERRNLRMAERLQAMTRGGSRFIAVGALHLPGARGLLQQLREAGYRVERRY